MQPRSTIRLSLPLAAAITALLAAQSALATTYYWDVNGTTAGFSTVVGAWNTINTFWNTSSTGGSGTLVAAPTAADDLNFKAATTNTGSITDANATTRVASSITFVSGVGAVTISSTASTPIQIGGTGTSSGIFNSSASNQTISVPLLLNSAATNFNISTSAAGTLKIGNVTGQASSGTQTLNIGASSGGAITLSGAFTEAGAGKVALNFNSSGSGTTTLQAANSYTGGTTFAAGTLIANTASTLPTSGGVVFSGGTLQVPLSGWATSEIDTLLGASTKTSGGLGLDTTASGSQTQWTAFTTTNLGGLGLTKAGTNALTLNQANTYTGATTISAGTLQVGSGGSAGSIDNTASVFIAANSTLLFNRTGTVNAGYVISGGGTTSTVTLTGGGTLALGATNNTFQGPFNVQNGTVSFSVWNGNNSNGPLGGGDGSKLILGNTGGQTGTLEYTASDTPTTNRSFTLATGGTGVVQIDNAAANVNMSLGASSAQVTGAGNLVKTGPGALTLSKNLNNYTGTTTIQAGSLVAGIDSSGTGTTGAFGNSSAGALILGNGSTLAGDAPALLINGAFSVGRAITVGSVSNANAYNATIGGSNTTGTSFYTGNITLNTMATGYTATLQAAAGGTVDFNTGTWTTNNKAIAIGSSGNTGTVSLSNAIATSGGLSVKYGTLALNSAFTGGNMTVAAGTTLSGTGSVAGTTAVTSATVNGTGLTLTGVTTFNSTGNVLSGTVSATSGVTLASGAALANNGALTGTLAIGNGTLTGTSGSVSGAVSLNGGTISLTNGTLGSTLGAAGGNWNGAGSVSGLVSSSGAFTIGSSGNLTASTGLSVTAGTTRVDGTLTGAASVASGATLGGTGTINGAAMVSGVLSPGDSLNAIARLASGALTFNNGSTFAYDMNSGSLTADFQTATGGLTLDTGLGGKVYLNLDDIGSAVLAPGTTLSLIDYTGARNGGYFTLGDTLLTPDSHFKLGANTWKITYADANAGSNVTSPLSGGHFINLTTLSAVPEPGTLLALGCLLGSGAFVRTRRRP